MKISNTQTTSSRVLIALTLSLISFTGLAGTAEAATCLTCHAPVGSTTDIRPVESTYRNISTGSVRGSHAKHIPNETLDQNACTVCHGAAAASYQTKHRDGFITVTSAGGIGYSKLTSFPQSGSKNLILGTCSTAACHNDPYSTSKVVSPVWGTAAANCSACHTIPIDATGPATGGHAAHAAVSAACTECHNSGTSTTSMPSVGHNDGNITIVNVGYPASVGKHAAGSGYSTCSNASCHLNVYGAGTVTTPVWGATSGCSACHTVAINAYGPNTGSHAKHNDGTCTDCHNAGTSAITKPATGHADGTITVNNGYPVTAKHAAGTYDVNAKCSTASCHDNGKGAPTLTPVWGATGVPACTACHALVPGDSHTKHVTSTLYKKAVCADCHTGYVQGSTAAANHINGTVEVNTGGYPSPKGKGSTFASCATSYCHSAGQAADGSAPPVYAAVAPTWGGTVACGSCHATTGPDIATGSHTGHLKTVSCGSCHAGATSSAYNSIKHVDNNIDVSVGTYTKAGAPGNGFGTCSTASCHDNPYSSGKIVTPVWGVNSAAGCAGCHNGAGVITAVGPATGSHVKHNDSTCINCHNVDTTATSSPSDGTHADGNVDVTNGYPATVAKHTINAGYTGTCSAASCHNNPYGSGSVVTPVWGTTSGCAACHKDGGAFTGTGSAPATGTHNAHMAISGTLCSKCHDGASANSNGGTSHNNGTVNVTNNYPATAKHAAGSYSGTCSNTANGCHGTMTTPVWGTINTYDTCTKCHGTGTPTASLTADNRYVLAPTDATATDTGNVSANAKIGAHQTHLRFLNGFSNYSTVDYRCQGCHGPLPSNSSHANGNSTPVFQGLATLNGTFTTSYNAGSCAVYCHNPAAAGVMTADAGFDTTPSWNNPNYIADGGKSQFNCNRCHKVPGDAGFSKQGAHGAMVTDAATDCAGCHGHNGNTTGVLGQRHLDGTFFANGACDSCHGYPPMNQAKYDARAVGEFVNARVENYAGGGGYHSSHLASTIVVGDEFKPCLPCHPSTSHKQGGSTVAQANINVFETTDTINRFDSARSKRYDASLTKCSNISCHFKPSPAWNL